MKHPPKLLIQTLMCTSLREKKILKLMKIPQVMMLVSIVFNQILSTHLSVVRCVLSQQTEKDDWRKVLKKIRNKSCKVIVDNENCINAISSKLCEHLGLDIVPHPHPFKVS